MRFCWSTLLLTLAATVLPVACAERQPSASIRGLQSAELDQSGPFQSALQQTIEVLNLQKEAEGGSAVYEAGSITGGTVHAQEDGNRFVLFAFVKDLQTEETAEYHIVTKCFFNRPAPSCVAQSMKPLKANMQQPQDAVVPTLAPKESGHGSTLLLAIGIASGAAAFLVIGAIVTSAPQRRQLAEAFAKLRGKRRHSDLEEVEIESAHDGSIHKDNLDGPPSRARETFQDAYDNNAPIINDKERPQHSSSPPKKKIELSLVAGQVHGTPKPLGLHDSSADAGTLSYKNQTAILSPGKKALILASAKDARLLSPADKRKQMLSPKKTSDRPSAKVSEEAASHLPAGLVSSHLAIPDPSNEEYENFLHHLRTSGLDLIRHRRNKKVKRINLTADVGLNKLTWGKKKHKKGSKVKEMKAVCRGLSTGVFEKTGDKTKEAVYFSLIFPDTSLDFEVTLAQEAAYYAGCFNRLIQSQEQAIQQGAQPVLSPRSLQGTDSQQSHQRVEHTDLEKKRRASHCLPKGFDAFVSLLSAPEGRPVKKHPRHGEPEDRVLKLDSSMKHLIWCDGEGSKKHSIPVLSITEVKHGRSTQVLEKTGTSERDHLYFSIVSESRTLDLEVSSKEERDFLVAGFSTLIELAELHSQHGSQGSSNSRKREKEVTQHAAHNTPVSTKKDKEKEPEKEKRQQHI